MLSLDCYLQALACGRPTRCHRSTSNAVCVAVRGHGSSLVGDVTHALQLLPTQRYPLPQHDLLVAALPSLLTPLRAAMAGAVRHAIAAVRLDTPI